MISRFRGLGCIVLLTSACAIGQAASARSQATLRVGLWTLWHDQELNFAPALDGAATVRICLERNACAAAVRATQTQIRATRNRLTVGKGPDAVSIEIAGPITLSAHGETLTLRNPLRISARNGELVLTVTLPVETYVERVVASESGPADSAESLKALAVVVRSFALHDSHGHADYDLCDSTHCQLLHWGSRGNRQAAHAATLATAGETLWFHSQRATAWFHQNCGGRTASPAEAWPAKGKEAALRPMPWLNSRVDPYCTAGGARDWSVTISLADLTAVLADAGLVRSGWKSFGVAQRGESGRAVTLKIGTTQISAEDFRLAIGRAMGWGKILSTWFEVSAQGDQFYFHGRGSGHGVGLCQAGAAAMSAAGRDYGQILAQYFSGANAADEATGSVWQSLNGEGFRLHTLSLTDASYLPRMNQVLAEAESRSGMQPGGAITVRAFHSTPAFRDATLAPGWVAAFTEGDWIGTQPLATLAARNLLGSVMLHEFLHALVEEKAAAGTPLWLREGLVEAWSEAPRELKGSASPEMKLDQVERGLLHARTEAESQAAHHAAGWYAQRLLDRYGREQVLGWLRNGVPENILAGLR